MRDFLPNLNIVGAVLVSRSGEAAHFTIRNLRKWCDRVLVVLDNSDEKTKKYVNMYRGYSDVTIVDSPFPGTTPEEEERDRLAVYRRWKNLQGEGREFVFEQLREWHKERPIDILIWPDHDEIFSRSLPKLLEKFWESPYKAITMKAVDIFGDFKTIHDEGMTGHTRIFKFFPELTARPYRWSTNYLPLKREERMRNRFVLVHLSLMSKEAIEWRDQYWSRGPRNLRVPLWRTGKDVYLMTPEEIEATYKREPDTNMAEYLRGGANRMPLGTHNATKALNEAMDMLDEWGIKTFVAFGTCLGLMRNGKLIAWDWDIDLISLGEDNDKILAHQKDIEARGWTEFKCKQDGPKWKKGAETAEEQYIRTFSFEKYGCRVDIDPAYLSKDGRHRIILKGRKRAKFAAQHPREWFDTSGAIKTPERGYRAPDMTPAYLESNYGPNWAVPKYGPTDWRDRACMVEEYECA